MGNLSEHFSTHELRCKGKRCCGGTCALDRRLLIALEAFREVVGVSIVPNSCFRCNTHNRRVGGAVGSKHTLGMAIDIPLLDGFTIQKMAAIAEAIAGFRNGGIILYNNFIHLDVRTGRYRKDNR